MAVGAHSRTATLPPGGGRRLDQSDTDSSDVDAGRATRLQHSLGDAPKNGPKDGAIDDPTDGPKDGPKEGPKDGPMDGRDDASTQEVPGNELDRALHFPRQLAGAVGKAGPSRRLNSVGGGRITLVLAATSDSSLVAAQASSHPVVVTSATGQVLTRAATHDVFIEMPANTPTCGYNTACASTPLTLVDMVATNPHPTESQAVRLSFSRNFETRDASLAQSGAHEGRPNSNPDPKPKPNPNPTPNPNPNPNHIPTQERARRSPASPPRSGRPQACSPPASQFRLVRTGTRALRMPTGRASTATGDPTSKP